MSQGVDHASPSSARLYGSRLANTAADTVSAVADLPARSRAARFLLVLLVVNLHTTRNIPGAGVAFYALFAACCALVVADLYILRSKTLAPQRHWVLLWLVLAFTGAYASVATISLFGSLYGALRFTFALPLYLAIIAYCRSLDDLLAFTRWATYFFTVAAATIPLQLFTGPIEWFKDETERGGLVRFPSLLGGLNAANGTAGVFIIFCQLIPGWRRWLCVAVIGGSVAMDLSKSGIASAAVGLVVLAALNLRQLPRMLAGLALAVTATAAFLLLVPGALVRVQTALLTFGVGSETREVNTTDVAVTESAIDRLTALPRENLAAFGEVGGLFSYLFGAGYGMASTAMVPSADSIAPMAHNQFVEIFTVWGLFGSAGIAWVLLRTVARLGGSGPTPADPETRKVRLIYLLALIVLLGRWLFANGSLYHPGSATPLFLILFAGAYLGMRHSERSTPSPSPARDRLRRSPSRHRP